jgi:hypothetical protein
VGSGERPRETARLSDSRSYETRVARQEAEGQDKPRDLKPQIAKRAYEIYEERGRHDGQADQDWLEAETEIERRPNM